MKNNSEPDICGARAYRVTIIYPVDPLGIKVGGVETFLKGFIKYAPENIHIKFIGITTDLRLATGIWHHIQMPGRTLSFCPVLYEKDENVKTTIPLSLRFVWQLMLQKIVPENSVLLFNRFEPSLLFSIKKFPKIIFIHNDLKKQILSKDSEVLWSKIPRLYFMLEKYLFSNASHVSTVCQSTLDLYFEKYASSKEKFSFVPTWVDTDVFNHSASSKSGLMEKLFSKSDWVNKKIILFVGRIQTQKAPIRLIDSFNLYSKNKPDARMVIVGEGNLKNSMAEHIHKLKLEDKIMLAGNVNQANLAEYYQSADALLLTSNFEGMPRCTLEALASGLPVVTTCVGEVKRVVKNGFSGEVVESFEPVDIALALKKVMDNPAIYTKENCVLSVKDYTPEKVLAPVYEKMRELYEEYYGK